MLDTLLLFRKPKRVTRVVKLLNPSVLKEQLRAEAKAFQLLTSPSCPNCQRANTEHAHLFCKGGAEAHDCAKFGDVATVDTLALHSLKDRTPWSSTTTTLKFFKRCCLCLVAPSQIRPRLSMNSGAPNLILVLYIRTRPGSGYSLRGITRLLLECPQQTAVLTIRSSSSYTGREFCSDKRVPLAHFALSEPCRFSRSAHPIRMFSVDARVEHI